MNDANHCARPRQQQLHRALPNVKAWTARRQDPTEARYDAGKVEPANWNRTLVLVQSVRSGHFRARCGRSG